MIGTCQAIGLSVERASAALPNLFRASRTIILVSVRARKIGSWPGRVYSSCSSCGDNNLAQSVGRRLLFHERSGPYGRWQYWLLAEFHCIRLLLKQCQDRSPAEFGECLLFHKRDRPRPPASVARNADARVSNARRRYGATFRAA